MMILRKIKPLDGRFCGNCGEDARWVFEVSSGQYNNIVKMCEECRVEAVAVLSEGD